MKLKEVTLAMEAAVTVVLPWDKVAEWLNKTQRQKLVKSNVKIKHIQLKKVPSLLNYKRDVLFIQLNKDE